MRLREASFALALLTSSALVIYGVSLLSTPAGYIAAGVLFAAWTWTVLSE